MPQGLLEVDGTVDIAQFWPIGQADADTTKVKVVPKSFRFRPNANAPFKKTKVFDKAQVRGKTGSKPILNKKGEMTIRLEGIDAPELHYTPLGLIKPSKRTAEQDALYKKYNLKYRQPFGETSTRELADLLAGANGLSGTVLTCRVTTAVDDPNDVFDTYGRFVGYLKADLGQGEVIINDWLCRKGWAFPGFYTSMQDHEITSLLNASDEARTKNRGVWPRITNDSKDFDFKLIFRPKGKIQPNKDVGDVMFPKLFRRVSEFEVNKKSKMVKGKFADLLATKSSDACFETDDFLAQGVSAAPMTHFAKLIDASGKFTRRPDQVVFRESPSTLVIPGGGKPKF